MEGGGSTDVWPATETHGSGSTRAAKEAIRKRGLFNDDGDLATPFRRLKLVMDYWCALWFWHIRGSGQLPSREQWWMEVGAILEGNVVDLTPQPQFDFALVADPQPELPGLASATQLSLLGPGPQTAPASDPNGPNLYDRFGQLRISRLREHFPRVKTVEDLATAARFLHWELTLPMCSPGTGVLIWCWGIRPGSRSRGKRRVSWARKTRCLPSANYRHLTWGNCAMRRL